jgi:hypothetical protein
MLLPCKQGENINEIKIISFQTFYKNEEIHKEDGCLLGFSAV